jgi:hypothetical protein
MALKFRRGTTAQKSGSLAFGEPYVNTTLGTLQIGLETGDVTLLISSASQGISGSSLDITGNAKIDGNLTLGGNITIGDQTSDTVAVNANLSSSLIPSATNTFDLGSSTKIWRDLYISTGSIKFVAGTSVVKELTLATITGLESATGSNDTKFNTLATYTGSVETRLNQIGVVSGSLISSASADRVSITNINTTTASLNTSVSNINTFSGSALTRLSALETETTNLELTTASLNTSVTNLNSFSSSQLGKDATLATYTASVDGRFTTLGTVTASYDGRFSTLGTYTGSVEGRFTTLATLTGSNATRLSNLETTTASLIIDTNNLETFTSSFNTAFGLSGANVTVKGNLTVQGTTTQIDSTVVNIADNIIQLNGTGATNAGLVVRDATAATTTSGSLLWDTTNDYWIAGPLGSELPIATTTGTQTLTNKTISGASNTLSNIANASLSNSAITIAGTSTSLGGSITLATITGTSGIVSGSSQVTPLLPAGTISGSSQVTGISNAQLTNSSVTIGTTAISLGASSTTLAGLTSVTSTGFTGALTGNASTATTLQTARTINGTSFNGSADITIPNLVSGSGQISGTGITNNTITIAGTSTSLGGTITLATITGTSGIISGSSQISGLTTSNLNGTAGITNGQLANSSVTVTAGTGMSGGGSVSLGGSVTLTNAGVTSAVAGTGVSVSGATGAVTISIGQSVATSATPTFAGLTINGAITATGDITAYYTSDKRHKNNIQIIPNALEKVSKLNGVTWEWNDDVNEVTKSTPKTGLIAQDVQSVLPEVVKEREDGFLSLDYSKMMGLMVEAIKEQQTQIHKLNLEIEVLKKQKGL